MLDSSEIGFRDVYILVFWQIVLKVAYQLRENAKLKGKWQIKDKLFGIASIILSTNHSHITSSGIAFGQNLIYL
jgi:hypothetical protein